LAEIRLLSSNTTSAGNIDFLSQNLQNSQNLLFNVGGSQPLAAGKQPVGVLPPTKKSFVGFAGFVGKKTQLCWNCPK
jgi:hypothetical protein